MRRSAPRRTGPRRRTRKSSWQSRRAHSSARRRRAARAASSGAGPWIGVGERGQPAPGEEQHMAATIHAPSAAPAARPARTGRARCRRPRSPRRRRNKEHIAAGGRSGTRTGRPGTSSPARRPPPAEYRPAPRGAAARRERPPGAAAHRTRAADAVAVPAQQQIDRGRQHIPEDQQPQKPGRPARP